MVILQMQIGCLILEPIYVYNVHEPCERLYAQTYGETRQNFN
jgi:hypothetical protein